MVNGPKIYCQKDKCNRIVYCFGLCQVHALQYWKEANERNAKKMSEQQMKDDIMRLKTLYATSMIALNDKLIKAKRKGWHLVNIERKGRDLFAYLELRPLMISWDYLLQMEDVNGNIFLSKEFKEATTRLLESGAV